MPTNPYEPPQAEEESPRARAPQQSKLALLVAGFVIGAVLAALAWLLLPAVQMRR